VHDPLALPSEAMDVYGIELMPLEAMHPADAVVLAVPHESYIGSGWSVVAPLLKNGRGIVIDVKAGLDRTQRPQGVELWRL
jgi:UDP-N-acetyl-D-galactosamine dehydrogenase